MHEYYNLPDLPYGYADLAPYISEEQLKIHHTKHHQGYVNAANKIFNMLAEARKSGSELDVKATLKELSFNVAGHLLHSLFWTKMAPQGAGGEPGDLGKALAEEFGSVERFKDEFSLAAVSAEGSGWAVLTYDPLVKKLMITQIEKHNVNLVPSLPVLMALDVWEHAYYLDYKNERAKFVEAFWNIVNWHGINERFKKFQ
ncbi:MAG: superoxide dismutase [Patescibacteria group bacterium]